MSYTPLFSSISMFHIIYIVVPGAILLGMGNSFFHVYGGRYFAVASRNDIRIMGVFVSTGALGLAIGLGFSSQLLLVVLLLTFLVVSYLHLHNVYGQETNIITMPSSFKQTSEQPLTTIPILFLSCLMLVVAGRAFIGENVPPLYWELHSMGAPWVMVMVSIIVMAGKAAGGFMSTIFPCRARSIGL